MAFCGAIFCAAAAFAANEPAKKIRIDLSKGTATGNYSMGEARMAGTIHAPQPVRRKMTFFKRSRQYYKTPRGRHQLARSFNNRIKSSYGNLNQ
ncbi:MAG: hypothetical protein ACAH80_01735 [Alphaproteobacteria bacterium]